MGKLIDFEVTAKRLRAAKEAPSFEPDFTKVLTASDDLGAVLRAHIYAEYRLGLLLRPFLPLDDQGERRLTELITLAQSKQVINAADASALRELNQLRNDFAHKLDFELTPERLKKFLSCLKGDIRDLYEDPLPEWQPPSTSPARERLQLRLALCAIDARLTLVP
jgi:hypothetical protein